MLARADAAIGSLRRHAGEACEIQRLRDRIAELEHLLGVKHQNVYQVLGMTDTEARLLGLLMRRDVITADAIQCALWGDRPECDQPTGKSVEVHICKLRKRLRAFKVSIINIRGGRYFIKASDKARVDEEFAKAMA